MPLCGTVGFLVFYGVAYFCVSVVNSAVPVLVAGIIDYRVAGQYGSWRILLHSFGTFAASAVCMPLLKTVGAVGTLTAAGLAQLISGGCYYLYAKAMIRGGTV